MRAQEVGCIEPTRRMELVMILVLTTIGCALAAVGALHFLGVSYCKDKTQAAGALALGLVFVAGGEVAVTGSSASFYKAQQLQTSVCELEGESAHPAQRRDDKGGVISSHIVGCMKSAGYDWTTAHLHCQEAPLATNPLCYMPRNALARAVTAAQVQFE